MNLLEFIMKPAAIISDWAVLKLSTLDRIDGVVICDCTPAQPHKDAFLQLTRQAMELIKSLDAIRYRRVCGHLRYIANSAILSRGNYGRALKICRIDYEKYFNSTKPQVNVRQYAGTLIHEATHGLLFDKGIPYNKETRERVEGLCHLEVCRFALRLEPEYAELLSGPYNPDWHRRFWGRSAKSRREAWWKRYREMWKASFPQDAKDFQQRSRTHTRKGEYDKAIADCDKAIQLDPQFAEAYFSRGTANLKKRDYDKAVLNYDRGIELNPNHALAYVNRGSAHLQKGDYDQAIADDDHAIRLDQTMTVAFLNRGAAHLKKRDYDRAIADFDRVIQLKPQEAWAYFNRGSAHLRRLDYGKASADYERAIEVDPRLTEAYKNLAWLLATCPQAYFRDGKKAFDHATKACRLSEWKDPGSVNILAAACAEAGDFENAVKWQSEYANTPRLSNKAKTEAQSRLVLYQSRQPYYAEPA